MEDDISNARLAKLPVHNVIDATRLEEFNISLPRPVDDMEIVKKVADNLREYGWQGAALLLSKTLRGIVAWTDVYKIAAALHLLKTENVVVSNIPIVWTSKLITYGQWKERPEKEAALDLFREMLDFDAINIMMWNFQYSYREKS